MLTLLASKKHPKCMVIY